MKKIIKFFPFIFIISVWLIFSYPYFLKGLVPFPSNFLVNFFAPWSAYPDLAGPIKNNATPDVITQIYPWKMLVINIWKSGNFPLWNPYSFSGTPLLANYQSAVFSPLNLLYFILPFIDAWSISVLFQPLLAGFFTYLFARSLKLDKFPSLLSAIAFMFCGFITTWMVYETLGYAILFLPLALYSLEKFFETKKWYFAALLTLSIPLSFFSGHFQTSIYFFIFVIAWLLFKLITTKQAKTFSISFLSIILGLFISMPQLLPSVELYFQTLRSELFLKTEVIPWQYLATFLAPDFFGNPVTRNDWFGHYAEWNAYIGLLPLMLGFYALRKRNSTVLFFAIASLVVLLLAFQTPLLDILINLRIPVLSTSAASRIIVLFSFSFSILTGFGFTELTESIKNKKFKPIIIWLGIFSLIFIFLWFGVLFQAFTGDDKTSIALSNLKLPTLIFAASLLSVLSAFFFKNKKTLIVLSCILILISSFDLLRFASKWQPFDPRKNVYPQVPVSRFISGISGYERAFGNYGAEFSMIDKIPSIEGYDALYVNRYGEFISSASDGKFHKAERSVVQLGKAASFSDEVINFLGVKYIIHKISDDKTVWTYPIWKYPVDQFTRVFEDPKYQIYENQKVFPRALIVNKYKVAKSNKDLLKAIFKENESLKEEVILEENIKGEISGIGSAVIKRYEPNKILIEAQASGNSLLVLSDSFYPGWKAHVDGRIVKILRANYAFRAIQVPSGKHVVEFVYDPDSFKFGMVLAMIGIVGTTGLGLYLRKK